MSKKKKIIFGILDLLLVGLLLLILGLCIGFNKNDTTTISIIVMAVTLLLPILLLFIGKNMGVLVSTVLLIVGNVTSGIIFLAISTNVSVETAGIVFGSLTGAYIVALMVCLLISGEDEKANKES